MNTPSVSKTEGSAAGAITVGVGFIASGELIAGGVAILTGIALFAAFHVLGMSDIELGEDEVEETAEEVSDKVDETVNN